MTTLECKSLKETRTVDAHVGRIRKKLDFQDVIQTIPRIGYRLEAGREEAVPKNLCACRCGWNGAAVSLASGMAFI